MNIYLSNICNTNGTLSCDIDLRMPNRPNKMYFSCDKKYEEYVNSHYDCFLIAMLPTAMALGRDIIIDGTIDAHLYENVLEAIALINSWFPAKYKIINITHKGLRNVKANCHNITASFYSGGVDSLFNIAGQYFDGLPKVDLCVLVRGMDISVSNDQLWKETSEKLKENIKEDSSLKVVSVETNARDFQIGIASWTQAGFGPLLGAVANFLSQGVERLLIGSYGLYKELEPHASNPYLDRLWSSNSMKVLHYSSRFSRLEKLKIIRDETPFLLKNLRVCWKNTNNQYNCGICEKCLRTKAELFIANAENLCTAFGEYDLAKDLRHLIGSIPNDTYTHIFWADIAKKINDRNIKKTIKKAIVIFYIKKFFSDLNRKKKSLLGFK